MSNLKVTKVSMIGFKNHVDLTEFNLSDLTKITGDNGQGKTTIGESISWAFLGSNLFGNEKADSTLVNTESAITEVSVEFIVDSVEHNLIRRRKGSKTDMYLDDEKATNLELRQAFGEKEIFLTVFNPEYFPSRTPKDAKAFLNQILEKVNNEEVFEKMGDYEKDLLISNNFKNSNMFLEDKRAELKETEEDLIYIDGLKDGKKLDEEVPEEKQFDATELNKLKEQLEKLETIEPVHNIQKIVTKKNDLEKEIFKLENTKEETVIRDMESRILQLRSDKLHPSIEKNCLVDIPAMENEKDLLLMEYKYLASQLASLNKSIKCNKCGNEMDLEQEGKEALNKEIKEIKIKGLNLKEQIEKYKESNKQIDDKYELELSNYNNKIDKDIKDLESQLKESIVEEAKSKKETTTQIIALKKEISELGIDSLEEENKASEEKNKADREDIKQTIKSLEQQEQDMKNSNENRNRIIEGMESRKKELEAIDLKAESQKSYINVIKQQIDAAKSFNAKKLDIQTENIEKHLDKVSVKLQEVVKSTGELKDTFKIMYEDREFNVLSTSEKIKAGLEIANLVMNVLDIKLPVFIDNAESITEYNILDTQIIEARVVEGKALTVEV